MGVRLPSADEVRFNLSNAKPGQALFDLGAQKFIAQLPDMQSSAHLGQAVSHRRFDHRSTGDSLRAIS